MNEAVRCAQHPVHRCPHSQWLAGAPVSDETLRELYALMKWGPTSANCSPARIVFIRTARGKRTSSPGAFQRQSAKNPDRASPLSSHGTVNFINGALFPHGDARSWFTSSPQLPKKQRFATVPCRRLILSSPAVRWGWIPARCRVLIVNLTTTLFCRQHAEEQSAD